MNIKSLLKKYLRPLGRVDFLSTLPSNSVIFDVGCGNNSPFNTKNILPDCIYYGIDVGDYNLRNPECADFYIKTTPANFHLEILKFKNEFDAVISSHNLEHCDNRYLVLDAMLSSVRPGGYIFISIPCEQSINFPSRRGTLNYFDDSTHNDIPPNYDKLIEAIKSNGFSLRFSCKRYSPLFLRITGFVLEPLSRLLNKVLPGTWEYYGFESIIIARKDFS